MKLKRAVAGLLTAGCFVAATMLVPGGGQAQDTKVKAAMEMLKSMAGQARLSEDRRNRHGGGQASSCHLFRIDQDEQ